MTETVALEIGPPTPVQICQISAEFNALLALYRDKKPKKVLEIGTASGGTLYHWLQNAQPGATIVTVDLPVPEYPSNEHLFDGWTPEGVKCVVLSGDSHARKTQAQVRKRGPYEFLFIDGSHEYEQVRQDWQDYSAMCTPGAVIALHDIALERSGVPQLWREIQAAGLVTREIRAHPSLTEYGIGCVLLP